MGGESSKTEAEKEKGFNHFLSQFGELSKIHHPFFGAIKKARQKDSLEDFVIVKDIWFQSEKDGLKYKELAHAREISHPFLMRVNESYAETEKTMCSTIVRCKFATKVPELTLAEVISKKRKKFQGEAKPGEIPPQLEDVEEYFSEPEIWYILDGLVGMAKQFKNIGFSHGFIQPENIYADADGHISLPDVLLYLNPEEDYDLTKGRADLMELERLKAAVAPEILELIKKEGEGKYDIHKSEVWSIGLTVLCICVNADISEFYDWPHKKIKQNTIEGYFDKMIDLGYSKDLVSVLAKAVEKNPGNRTSLDDLHQYLIELDTQMQENEKALATEGAGFNKSGQIGEFQSQYVSEIQAPLGPMGHSHVQESHFVATGPPPGYQSSYRPPPPSNSSPYTFGSGSTFMNAPPENHSGVYKSTVGHGVPQTSSIGGYGSASIVQNNPSYVSQYNPPVFSPNPSEFNASAYNGPGVYGSPDHLNEASRTSSMFNAPPPSYVKQSNYAPPSAPVQHYASQVSHSSYGGPQPSYSGATNQFMTIGGGDWMTKNLSDSKHF